MSLNELTAYENGFNYAEAYAKRYGMRHAVEALMEDVARDFPCLDASGQADVIGKNDALLLMVTA